MDHDSDEVAVIEGRGPCFLRGRQRGVALAVKADEVLAEINLAKKKTYQRHDEVVDDRGDDFSERGADHHTHGEIDGIPFGDKCFELLKHSRAVCPQPSDPGQPKFP